MMKYFYFVSLLSIASAFTLSSKPIDRCSILRSKNIITADDVDIDPFKTLKKEHDELRKTETLFPSTTVKSAVTQKKAAPKKGGGAVHQEGVFSPIVIVAKSFLGEPRLNKVRGQFISLHSDIIGTFVDTSSSPLGKTILSNLFVLVDKNGDGSIDEDELKEAFETLGFTWLKEKQVGGILKRADLDKNGVIDYDEFMDSAPKTLRTNLVKLAKKNGAEMGLLV